MRWTPDIRVPKIRVRVLAQRPADDDGELHGLYEPDDAGTPARITVWMRTAARKDVVAFKTFLRTLIHELCHHLDYELYKMPETFHTEGFYKRESTLVAALLARGVDARAISWVESSPLPEERCNRKARPPARLGYSPLQPRSLNRACARGDETLPAPAARSPMME